MRMIVSFELQARVKGRSTAVFFSLIVYRVCTWEALHNLPEAHCACVDGCDVRIEARRATHRMLPPSQGAWR